MKKLEKLIKMEDKLYTVAEYAELKGISKKTVYKRIDNGLLEVITKSINNRNIKYVREKEPNNHFNHINPIFTPVLPDINPDPPDINPTFTQNHIGIRSNL